MYKKKTLTQENLTKAQKELAARILSNIETNLAVFNTTGRHSSDIVIDYVTQELQQFKSGNMPPRSVNSGKEQ